MSAMDQTERTAERIREDLSITLRELERRRHQVTDVGHHLRAYQTELMIAAGVAVVGLGFGLGASIMRNRRRHSQKVLFHERFEGVKRAWNHPGRIATRAQERPLGQELVKKVVTIVVTALATKFVKEGLFGMNPVNSPRAYRQNA